MEPHELHQHAEEARAQGQKAIGLTTAIVAVLLAVATMLGSRTHGESGKLETAIADQWSFYSSKHSLTHTFAADEQQAELDEKIGIILAARANAATEKKAVDEIKSAAEQQAAQYRASGQQEERESEDVRRAAQQMEAQVDALSRRSDIYNLAELFLQISIVLCSIALLAESRRFWQISFLATLAGVGLILFGLIQR